MRSLAPRLATSRHAVLPAAFLLLQGACVGTLETPGGQTPEERAAIQSFEKDVVPILNANCGACHSTMVNIDFMVADPDVRTRMMTWPNLINLIKPADSKLLTKGAHDGPALLPEQATAILGWIELERLAAGGEDTAVELAPFQPVIGLNLVDLTPIGLTGSSITFRLDPLSVGMYLSEIMINAGAGGATLEHPLLVVWEAGSPQPDPIDRFAGIELAVPEGESAMIGGGTAVLVDVPSTAMMSIHFKRAAASGDGVGGGDGGGGGEGTTGQCKDVAAFTASARQALSTSCVSCHGGGNAAATNATDMRQINDLSETAQADACAQILSRVTLPDPPNSGIFVAPDPGSGTGHPFKFGSAAAFTGFREALIQWINQENAQ
jgi:cytochrome c553